MAQPVQHSFVRRNWVAWTFNFFYPLMITALCVFIISRYFGLPIADNMGKELFSLLRGAINWFTFWLLRFF